MPSLTQHTKSNNENSITIRNNFLTHTETAQVCVLPLMLLNISILHPLTPPPTPPPPPPPPTSPDSENGGVASAGCVEGCDGDVVQDPRLQSAQFCVRAVHHHPDALFSACWAEHTPHPTKGMHHRTRKHITGREVLKQPAGGKLTSFPPPPPHQITKTTTNPIKSHHKTNTKTSPPN